MSGRRVWISSGNPRCIIADGQMAGWVLVIGPCGLMFFCIALSQSEVYHLTVDTLPQMCSERGLYSSGPVPTLRQRLPAEHVKSKEKETSREEKMVEARTQTDLLNNLVEPSPKM